MSIISEQWSSKHYKTLDRYIIADEKMKQNKLDQQWLYHRTGQQHSS